MISVYHKIARFAIAERNFCKKSYPVPISAPGKCITAKPIHSTFFKIETESISPKNTQTVFLPARFEYLPRYYIQGIVKINACKNQFFRIIRQYPIVIISDTINRQFVF